MPRRPAGAALACLVGLCAAGTGLSAQPLPDRITGTWALERSDCSAEGAADFRIEITATDVVFAASHWSSPNWKPLNQGWRAIARVEEGGAGRLKGRHAITLRLGRDGRLTINRQGEADIAYHRCPPVPRTR
ncbi:hypothetical protein [Bosea sp. (in: a-proteobacteria)]|uniref:hypothetical protein n=1 Tax=Bosea sp. (in: a-proteobacteria) TaxID=1871050 RepID=UPI002732EC86|nr:hypothetical protein [Bosea sp. (in: a-proteobacteria)]MDP3407627.1 hypothetical protein [Bosea sp. (in: a-proteobacteria)]